MKPTSKTSRIFQIAAIVVAAIAFLLWSYVCANQPNCPNCRNADHVVFTWKTYQSEDPEKHEFTTLGPVGYCRHYLAQGEAQPEKAGSWYCTTCKKHIIRPSNWRSADKHAIP